MMNHLIDPTYFYDAIEEFAFDYVIYVVEKDEVDEYGYTTLSYQKRSIRGSLQIQQKSERQSKDGNTHTVTYKFYCKSLYRIDIGDILEYDGNYLRVNDVHPYDEYGVREAALEMIQLAAYRDFAAYLKYISGINIV